MAESTRELVEEVLINLQFSRILRVLKEVQDEIEDLQDLIGDNGDEPVGGKRVSRRLDRDNHL